MCGGREGGREGGGGSEWYVKRGREEVSRQKKEMTFEGGGEAAGKRGKTREKTNERMCA